MDSIEDYLRKRRQGSSSPAAMLFDGKREGIFAALDDDSVTIGSRSAGEGSTRCARRERRMRPPGPLKSIPPVTDVVTGDEFKYAGRHTPPPLKVVEMTFSGAAEALAAYPVRPRLRCGNYLRPSLLRVFAQTQAAGVVIAVMIHHFLISR